MREGIERLKKIQKKTKKRVGPYKYVLQKSWVISVGKVAGRERTKEASVLLREGCVLNGRCPRPPARLRLDSPPAVLYQTVGPVRGGAQRKEGRSLKELQGPQPFLSLSMFPSCYEVRSFGLLCIILHFTGRCFTMGPEQ